MGLQDLSNIIIFNVECYIAYVDVWDKDFWMLSVLGMVSWDGWGFLLQNQLTRWRLSYPVALSSAKMLSSGSQIYEENVPLMSISNLKVVFFFL